MVEMLPVKSSNIEKIGYDKTAQKMYVKFPGSEQYYVYEGVSESIYGTVMGIYKAPEENHSIGSAFSKLIKNGGYKWHQLKSLDETKEDVARRLGLLCATYVEHVGVWMEKGDWHSIGKQIEFIEIRIQELRHLIK